MDAKTPDDLAARFLRGLALSPDRAAVRIGADQLAYKQAHALALHWAGALAPAEPGPKAVGILAGKSTTGYVGILAALYAGAAVVPLRPDFPAVRTAQMLAAAGVETVIADAAGLAALPALAEEGVTLSVLAPGLAAAGDDDALRASGRFARVPLEPGRDLPAPRPVGRDDPAYILFTSGSTGRPKGVVITHGNAGAYFRLIDARYDFNPRDVFSQAFDLNFDCSLFDLFCAWGAGACAVAVPPHAYRELPAFVAEQRITVWFSTPGVIDLIRRMGGLSTGSMPGVRWSLFAGEALQCRDAAAWHRAAGASRLENLYGPTELTVTIAAHRWTPGTSPALAVNGVVPIGSVHEGHEHFLLLDGDLPDDGAVGTEGELCIAGPQLTSGYLEPADGAGRFITRDGQRFYRTGDRVRRLPGEEFAYLGRLDSQVQIQGWRIELAEVEHALRGIGLHDAAAVAVTSGAGTQLFAFYIGEPLAPAEIVRRLRTRLPDGAIPKHYRNLSRFPLNSNRKVDRVLLRAQADEQLAIGDRSLGVPSA